LNPIATCDDHWTPPRECSRHRGLPMVELLWGIVLFIIRAIIFVLDVAVSISRMQKLARLITGSDAIVAVPPEPKILPPAVQRARAGARPRRHDDPSSSR
jgi:hypothetical protein